MAAIQKDVKAAITFNSKEKLDEALSKHDNLILGEVVKSGTVEMLSYLLERQSRPQGGEIYALYKSGTAGNVSVFRHVLERNTEIDFSARVPGCGVSLGRVLERSNARPIWDALRDHGQQGIALVAALKADDLGVFREILEANPELDPDDRVLMYAVDARVEFWDALLDHNPRLAHACFGEFGDGEYANVVGLIVKHNNFPLLSMMVGRGVDITDGRFLSVPVLYVAKWAGASSQMIDLLVENGAEMDEED